jgi:N-acetylmuramoyl-L-alanine amidase
MAERVITGTMSVFGGPKDTGVSPSEGLALCELHEMELFPEDLFLPQQPPNTTGLARRLNPEAPYVAARWDYDETPRSYLQGAVVIVTNTKTGKQAAAQPIDWGPHEDTERVCDLSPGLAELLELETDDECSMKIPLPPVAEPVRYERIFISSGHGLKVRGAAGPSPWGLDEVNEARKVVEELANELRKRGVKVDTFHDDTSTTQQTNLKTITAAHNSADPHDLDISCHFNAFDQTAHGTEVLYVSQSTLANQLSSAISKAGPFTNRGGKRRTDLYFLNNTRMPAILTEQSFCDNKQDCDTYRARFAEIVKQMAMVLSGAKA